MTRENYLFSYLGETVLDGQSYYLLRLDPRRKQAELISGRAWVDKESFLIRRLEGTVKSPSIWVKTIRVQDQFRQAQKECGSLAIWWRSPMYAFWAHGN